MFLKFQEDASKTWQVEEADIILYKRINFDVNQDGSGSEYNKKRLYLKSKGTSNEDHSTISQLYRKMCETIKSTFGDKKGFLFFLLENQTNLDIAEAIVVILKKNGSATDTVYIFPYQSMAYDGTGGRLDKGIYIGNSSQIFILNDEGKTIEKLH